MKTLLFFAVLLLAGIARGQLVETNVALGKPASGDTAFGYPPSNGNDGNVASFNHADNINAAPANPYWSVDLQGPFDLKRLEIVDRIGCCDPNRLNGSEIRVYDSMGVQIGDTMLVDGLPSSSPDLAAATRVFDNNGAGWQGAASVRVDGYTQYFQFSEFRAIAMLPPAPVNVAVKGLVTASGPLYGAQKATSINDGNPATFAHPDTGAAPGFTFTLNLFDSYAFDRLEVLNRSDCCPDRLSNYRVSLHQDDGTGNPGPAVWSAVVRADGSDSGFSGVDTLTAPLDPAGVFAGQFIRVENLSNTDYNPQIAELRAFAQDNSPVSLALGKPAGFYDASGVAVSPWPGFAVTNIVDGQPGTFSHPQPQSSANYYFQTDLGADTSIGKIKINGRLDGCCPERLADARLEVLDEALAVVFQQVLSGQVVTVVTVDTGGVTGRYIRVVNAGGADYGPQIGELSVFAPDTPAPPVDFRITSLTVNRGAGTGSLTFNSEAGSIYTLLASGDLSVWVPVQAGFPASETPTTTVEFTDAGLTDAVSSRYYRVKKLPPLP